MMMTMMMTMMMMMMMMTMTMTMMMKMMMMMMMMNNDNLKYSKTLERCRITFTANGEQQIQAENFSKWKMGK